MSDQTNLELSETKKIAINDKGIFIVETSKLHPFQIAKLRRKFQTRIVSLRMEIQDLYTQEQRKQNQIRNLEVQLKELSTPLIESLIEKEKQRIRIINEKAQQLLKETVGESVYAILQERGWFKFKGKDDITYKIDKRGNVFRQQNKEWRRLCIIRPSELPMPDFILSLFINVREHPTKYSLARR